MRSKCYLIILLTFIEPLIFKCQGQDNSPAGVMISHSHPKGGWMLSYSFMQMKMKGNLQGSTRVSDENVFVDYLMSPQSMRMDMHMIMLMYGLTGRLSLMAMGTYTNSTMDMNMLPGVMHMHGGSMEMSANSTNMSMSSSGFGDTKLWSIYKLFNGESSSWVASLGVSIPTGSISVDGGNDPMFAGQRLPYMMQLGSGTVDFMPGLTYLKKSKKITWSVQALSILRTMDNQYGYHYGNELNLNAWVSYQIRPVLSASLRAEGFGCGSVSGSDKKIYYAMEPDADPRNYGGTKLNVHAGLNFYLDKGVFKETKIGVEFGAPLFQNVNGIQLATSYLWSAGVTKSF